MIAVVDYHKGNLKSVERGLRGVGADARITDDPARIASARAIVLPGVGSFTEAAQSLEALGQAPVLRERIQAGIPFLGICLGMHLLFEAGEEHADAGAVTPGLGLIPGVVGSLPAQDAAGRTYKIPHVGWNTVDYCGGAQAGDAAAGAAVSAAEGAAEGASAAAAASAVGNPAGDAPASAPVNPLFAGIPSGEHFYFTHSFAVPENPFTIATTTHSVPFPCAVALSDACFAVQFHPEKSSDAGARLLQNFVRIAKAVQ